jgi:DNA-binding NtrC family response regulator
MDADSGIVSIVDDEPAMRRALSSLMCSVGYDVRAFATAQEYLTAQRPDGATCLVLDVQLPGLSGLDLQEELAKRDNPTPIIFLTGHGDIPMTVRAIRAGAVDFLTKPVNGHALLEAIRRGMTRFRHQRLADQGPQLGAVETKTGTLERHAASVQSALDDRFGFDAIIGRAPSFVAVVDDARKVAATNTTVLLTGESGTGKEILARAIHRASPRADGPFVAVNCAALPETLVESELFGHERGAFTGADRLKRGRFELAARGTLFLDEIGELTPAVQAKLLRVLQERRYERVGATTSLEADVRLVAATNRDLERSVAEGRFREDLYYRLAVFRVHLPPLRERGDDVLLLAHHFVRHFGARMGKGDVDLSREARDALLAHSWAGNIRELQNAIERALILADGELITPSQLGLASPAPPHAPIGAATIGRPEAAADLLTLAEQEQRMITETLRRAKGNKSRTAAALGLSRFQLLRRLRRYDLNVSSSAPSDSRVAHMGAVRLATVSGPDRIETPARVDEGSAGSAGIDGGVGLDDASRPPDQRPPWASFSVTPSHPA